MEAVNWLDNYSNSVRRMINWKQWINRPWQWASSCSLSLYPLDIVQLKSKALDFGEAYFDDELLDHWNDDIE